MSSALPASVAEKRRNFAAILRSFRQTNGAIIRMKRENEVSVAIMTVRSYLRRFAVGIGRKGGPQGQSRPKVVAVNSAGFQIGRPPAVHRHLGWIPVSAGLDCFRAGNLRKED